MGALDTSWYALKQNHPIVLKAFCPQCGMVGLQEPDNSETGEQGTFHCTSHRCGWSGKPTDDQAAMLDPRSGDIIDTRKLRSPGEIPPEPDTRAIPSGRGLETVGMGGGHVVSDVSCQKCGSNNVWFKGMLQTRSSDEPEVRFYTCLDCDKTFREV